MQSKSKINEEIDFVKNLKIISQSYQEISVMRIQRIRSKVLQTRVFVDSIQDVFENVKASYKKKKRDMMEAARKKKKSQITEDDSEIAVFISANSRLYGDIVSEVFRDFVKYIKKNECEVMIVGKLGKELWNEVYPDRKILYAELSDNEIKNDSIANLIEPLSNFKKINVFHGKYETIINQSPTKTNLTGDINEELETKNTAEIEVKNFFLFEPSVEELAEFFEKQVITALMKQSLHESELSLHASRIKAMELALQSMDKKEQELHLEDLRFRGNLYNKNQQTSLLGISIWKNN